jgi:hypothetical protein
VFEGRPPTVTRTSTVPGDKDGTTASIATPVHDEVIAEVPSKRRMPPATPHSGGVSEPESGTGQK